MFWPRRVGDRATVGREASMVDAHQVNTIIASAICDCRKDHPEGRIDTEEAKTIAKCILEQLSGAGFQIVHADEEK